MIDLSAAEDAAWAYDGVGCDAVSIIGGDKDEFCGGGGSMGRFVGSGHALS